MYAPQQKRQIMTFLSLIRQTFAIRLDHTHLQVPPIAVNVCPTVRVVTRDGV